VRALLARHGLTEQRVQLPRLMDILGVSYSQAYRKLNAGSPWLEEDLYRLATHFGETLGTLFADAPPREHGGIAVVDDDPIVADSIVDTLQALGIDARAYYDAASLLQGARSYDAYIVDWFMGTGTAENLLLEVRRRDGPAPVIVVLTGKISSGAAEDQLARMVRDHGILVELKPARVSLLLAKIQRERDTR
jgi:CheY-like chemotaxis protein